MKLLPCILILLLPISGWADDTLYLSGTTDVEDTYIKSSEATTNYGTSEDLFVGSGYGAIQRTLMRFPNFGDSVNDFSDVVIKSVHIMLYFDDGVGVGDIYAFYASKPYVENQATHNIWKTAYEWGTTGANDLGSVWNEGDGTGDDRGSSSQGSVTIDWDLDWNYLSVDTAKVNDWLRADSANSDTLNVPAWIVMDNGGGTTQWFHSSEYSTDTTKTARLQIVLTVAPVTGPPNVRHGPEGTGQRHGPDGASVRHGP